MDEEREREFKAMYRSILPLVYRYTTVRLGQAAGEDVTSEVFHAAAVAYNEGRSSQVTPAWVMTVARNKVIDQWRSSARRKARSHLLRPGRHELVAFPDGWARDDRRDFVLAALDKVSDRHRTLLILHYVDGMPAAEIADSLGQSQDAIESALARARRSFKQNYEPARKS